MRKLTNSEFRKRVNQKYGNRFEILSNYHGIHSKVKIRCNKCNWIGEIIAGNLIRQNYGARCPKHGNRQFDSSSFQKAINEKQDNQYTLLSEYTGFKDKVKVKCNKCGKIFNVCPNSLLGKRMGKNCNHEIKLNFKQASKRLSQISNGEIKLVHFSGTSSIATFKCLKCGNTWKTTADNVFRLKSGCPICSSSRGEQAIIKYFKKKNILFKRQFRLKECKDKKPLPFDFAVFNKDRSLNCLIEYQGCQHFMDLFQFKKNDFFSRESVLSTQKHDKMKSTFCQKHGIKLIHIDHPQNTSEYSFIVNLVQRTLDKELKVN